MWSAISSFPLRDVAQLVDFSPKEVHFFSARVTTSYYIGGNEIHTYRIHSEPDFKNSTI